MVTPQIDEIGRIIGDPSRAAILLALLDGRAWTGRELAAAVHVTAPTASEHLKRLVDASFLSVVAQGRSRYYRIASPDVAHMLETIMAIAPPNGARTPKPAAVDAHLRAARTCYDHLAGELGVALAQALVNGGAITVAANNACLIDAQFFARSGVIESAAAQSCACRLCLDWTQRRFHIGGRLGAAIAQAAFQRGWVLRRSGTRALDVSPAGLTGFAQTFGLQWKGNA